MKKTIIVLIVATICSAFAYGQEGDSGLSLEKENYLQLSKQQTRNGWILTGIGLSTTVVGMAIYISEKNSKPDLMGDWSWMGASVAALGSIMIAGGIYYWIRAGVNKQKAMKIALTAGPQPYLQSDLIGLNLNPTPSVKIVFNF